MYLHNIIDYTYTQVKHFLAKAHKEVGDFLLHPHSYTRYWNIVIAAM